MNSCYLSLPSIVCSAGNEREMLENVLKSRRFLKEKEFLGKIFLVGEVENQVSRSDFPRNLQNFYTKTNALLFQTALQIILQVEKLKTQFGRHRIGVCIGSTTVGLEENFQYFQKERDFKLAYDASLSSLGNPALFIQKFFDISGACFGVSTACTSGLKALFQAYRLIQSNLCDGVIVGGVDALSSISLFGFDSLGILSSKPCNPFSTYREGINIGEGSCLFVMSKIPLNTSIILESFCSNNDAFHLTRQDIQANKAREAINMATKDYSIDYINLHATGTRANEIAESQAIASTLPHVPASGIKGCIGHTLGAAGAIEAGLCTLLLDKKNVLLPAHIYDGHYDQTLPNFSLIHQSIPAVINRAMSINFAFGGDNAVAVFGRKR